MTVELRSGDGGAVVTGGPYLTVTSWRAAGRELLVASEMLPSSYRVHGKRAGITLLHPWANRLRAVSGSGAGTVSVGGRKLVFAADDETVGRDPNGLPIHGLASSAGWQLQAESESVCRGSAAAPAVRAFPFSHRVDVRLELSGAAALTVETTVTCTEEAAVPVAFGWHPYFRVQAASDVELGLPDREHLELDSLGLPTGAGRPEPGGTVRAQDSPDGRDDAYTGIAEGSVLSLRDSGAVVEVVLEHGFNSAQVFAPADAPVVSLEPMSAPTDALRTGCGLRFARPREPFSARFTIRLSEAPAARR